MDRWGGATPAELIDDLGHAVAEQYRLIEEQLAETLQHYAERAIAAPPDLTQRLRAVRDIRAQAERLVAGMDPDKIADAVTAIAGDAASAEISRLLFEIPALSGTLLSAGGLLAVAAAQVDLRDSLRALNERVLRSTADAYQSITASTVGDMLAGQSTWQQVQRKQLQQYLARGITGFVDKSGRRWTIGSYAEMATRTAAARAWRDQSTASMNASGISTYRIIGGLDACGDCGEWFGKVLSDGPTGVVTVPHAITAKPTQLRIDSTVSEARAQGWGHPNCRCVLIPALPGYDAGDATTHDPEAEQQRDKLRELERDVRAAKRSGTPEDVKAAQAALREHTKATGLQRRYFREQLAFSDGKS